MANMKLSKTGDWAKVRHVLGYGLPKLAPHLLGKMDEYGNLALEIIGGHINRQSLPWTPLSEETVRIKGHDKIYVETGVLSNGLEVKKFGAGGNEVFIGFSDGVTHESGLSFATLMVYNEYGTVNSPARPLIRPSFEETRELIKKDLMPAIRKFFRKHG